MSKRIVLICALLWSVAAFAASVRTILVAARPEVIDLRHDMRHAISESTEWDGAEKVLYFDEHWHASNLAALWHAGTALILGVVSVWGLRQRDSHPPSADNALEQTRDG